MNIINICFIPKTVLFKAFLFLTKTKIMIKTKTVDWGIREGNQSHVGNLNLNLKGYGLLKILNFIFSLLNF